MQKKMTPRLGLYNWTGAMGSLLPVSTWVLFLFLLIVSGKLDAQLPLYLHHGGRPAPCQPMQHQFHSCHYQGAVPHQQSA